MSVLSNAGFRVTVRNIGEVAVSIAGRARKELRRYHASVKDAVGIRQSSLPEEQAQCKFDEGE
jgi:hypothetical protein